MSLKKKLLLYNLVLSAFLVVSGGIGYVGSKTTSTKYEHVVQVNMRINEALNVMDTAKARVLFNLYRMANPSFSFDEREQILAPLGSRIEQYKKADEEYRSIAPDDGSDDELYRAVAEGWKVIEGHSKKFVEYTQTKNEEGVKAMQTAMKDSLEKDRVVYDEAMGLLISHHRNEAAKWISAAHQSAHSANTLGILALVGALLASIASGLLIGQAMSKQISMIAGRLTQSSSGVFQESIRVSSASTQLAAAMSEQASAIQETVAAVDEISAMVAKTSDNSQLSQSESGRMNDVAMKGKESLDQVVASISDISDSNNQILQHIEQGNQQLEKIVTLINQIGEKTKVINEIVFQTKLLSFNASVEAARAGEHGRGFAVVAEEVGNLATMSGNAAKEISEMLDASTGEVRKIVSESKDAITSLMGRTRGKFEESRGVARECARIFDQIITQMEAVKQNVNDIATASREQSVGIREINHVMNGLSGATQQNSRTTEETANSALQLKRQAEDVKTTVAELMTLVTGQLNNESPVRPVTKPVNPSALEKVEKAKIGTSLKDKVDGSETIRSLANRAEAKKTVPGHQVTMASKTKPIASSALMKAKPTRTDNVIPMTKEKPAVEKPADENPTAKAVGSEIEDVPDSDDDRFEKV